MNLSGFKAFLSKEGRRERSLSKAVARAGDVKLKPDDRRPALFQLMDDGGPEAVGGLLKRLTYNYDTNIVADEEEKNYVYEGLVAMGDRIVPQLRGYFRTSPSLSWGLRILKDVCTPEQAWEVVQDIMRDYEPGYERDPSRKQQLLSFLGDFSELPISEIVLPFLQDHDETVRFIAAEALLNRGDEEASRKPLIKVLIDEEEESLRLKNRIAEGFLELGWTVKGYRGTVEKIIPDGFVVDGKGRIKRKKGSGS